MINHHTTNGHHAIPDALDLLARIAELERRMDALGQVPVCPYIVIFTKRENATLQALWNGHTTATMLAHHLHMSQRTVQTHFENMFRKAGVQSKVELLLWAMRKGGTK